jgi:hypothetical protein
MTIPQDEQNQVQDEPKGPPTSEEEVDLFNVDPEPPPVEIPEATPETQEPPTEQTPEQPETPEAAPEPATAVPDELRSAMERIEQAEMRLRERETQFKQNAIAAQELADFKKALKDDPISAIQNAGGDPSALMESIVGPDPEQQQLAENPMVKRLLERVEAMEQANKKGTETRQQEIQQYYQDKTYGDLARFAKEADQEQFPLLSVFSEDLAPDTMFDKTAQYVQQHGKMPPVEQIARETQKDLDEQAVSLIKRLSANPRYAKVIAEAIQGDGQPEPATTSTAPQPNGTTLRQQHSATPPPARVKDWSKVSDREIVKAVASHATNLFDED